MVGVGLAEEAGLIGALIHKLIIITYVTGMLMIDITEVV